LFVKICGVFWILMGLRDKAEKVLDSLALFFVNFSGRIRGLMPDMSLTNKKIIVILSVFAIVLAGIGAGFYYYFQLYMSPNFGDSLSNNVITHSMEDISPGDILSYEVNYKNTGYRDVDLLEITIPIPGHTKAVSFTEGGELDEKENTLVYAVRDLPRDSSGQAVFELEVDTPLDNGTKIEMGDVILAYSIGDQELETILDGGPGHRVESSPDLGYVKITSAGSGGDFVFLGDELSYAIEIKNTGDMTARDVEIRSSPSGHLTIKTESIGQSGRYSDGEIIWILDEIRPGGSKRLAFRGILESGGVKDRDEITTTVSAFYKGSQTGSDEVSDIARLFPDFSESTVTLTDANGGSYLWAGEAIDVKVTLKNTGYTKAEKYSLYCPVPAQATYVSKSGTAEGIRWDDGIRGLIWDMEGLEVGQSREITFKMTVNSDHYYKSSTLSTEFHIAAYEEEFPIEPASIYIQGHPYLNVVAMGDSLITKSDWVQRLDNKLEAAFPAADYNTSASGVSGEMSFQGLNRYDSTVGPLHPTILIVAYGTNDVGGSQSYFSYSIDNIIAKARGQGATVFINLIGPITQPGKSEWPIYNNIIRQVAAKHGIPVIDVTTPLSQNKGGYLSDGMHYTSAGSEVVAQTVFNNIVPYLNSLGGRK
jgi:lysophospholipase L1-like esterase